MGDDGDGRYQSRFEALHLLPEDEPPPPMTTTTTTTTMMMDTEEIDVDDREEEEDIRGHDDVDDHDDGEDAGDGFEKADRKQSRRMIWKNDLVRPLFWIDLEMTGLNPDRDVILEAACLFTDLNLIQMTEGPCVAIHHPEEVLTNMNEWSTEIHNRTGLTERCRASRTSEANAEDMIIKFIDENTPENYRCTVAGNSVHVDLAFIRTRMPRLYERLDHRIVDVSTIAQLGSRWFFTTMMGRPRKKHTHEAMSDIKESVEELKYYRDFLFKPRPKYKPRHPVSETKAQQRKKRERQQPRHQLGTQ